MYKLLLCGRYLRTRYIALASIISVMLGVATMIVVNSVMAGFGSEMRDRIKGILSDIVIEAKIMDGEKNPEAQMRLIREVAGEYIAGMATTVEVYGMLSFRYGQDWVTSPITLIGIEPETKAQVGPLVDYLQSYRPDATPETLEVTGTRQPGEHPNWNLTPAAHDYRVKMAEHQKWFIDQLQGDGEAHNPAGAAALPTGSAGSEPAAAALMSGSAVAEAGTADAEASTFENPFEAPDAPRPEGSQSEPAVPEEPGRMLPGRLYVGAGLISFPFEDKEAGGIRTYFMVRPGDDVKVSTVSSGRPPEPVHFNATIVDVFKSGMSEYDSSYVFCNLEYLQQIRGMVEPTTGARAVTSIQVKLKDYRQASEVMERLRAVFPAGMYAVRTWEQKQGPLLAAVDVESAILNVLLFLIITVAGFGILAIFYMIVVEKTRDIGILKALGASSTGVMSIFLSYGLALGLVGSGVGVASGLLFVRYINEIEGLITLLTGRKVFDERIYYFPKIPTHVEWTMVFWVASGAIAIAIMASILPARRAARLHPVQALRYDA